MNRRQYLVLSGSLTGILAGCTRDDSATETPVPTTTDTQTRTPSETPTDTQTPTEEPTPTDKPTPSVEAKIDARLTDVDDHLATALNAFLDAANADTLLKVYADASIHPPPVETPLDDANTVLDDIETTYEGEISEDQQNEIDVNRAVIKLYRNYIPLQNALREVYDDAEYTIGRIENGNYSQVSTNIIPIERSISDASDYFDMIDDIKSNHPDLPSVHQDRVSAYGTAVEGDESVLDAFESFETAVEDYENAQEHYNNEEWEQAQTDARFAQNQSEVARRALDPDSVDDRVEIAGQQRRFIDAAESFEAEARGLEEDAARKADEE